MEEKTIDVYERVETMSAFLAELFGTTLLIYLGNSVVANVNLKKTNGHGESLLLILIGWAVAVALPVYIFGPISGAHFNPAVTLGQAVIGKFEWAQVPVYMLAQLLGAMMGATLVYIHYLPHWKVTTDSKSILSCFATGPAIDEPSANFISEFLATAALVFMLLGIGNTPLSDEMLPIAVGLVILGIGLTLGGTTGYAINPTRDLGPRIMYSILPIPNKGSANWSYAWIPVVAPFCGGVVGALLYSMIF